MTLNDLYKKYPHLFQFAVQDFDFAIEEEAPKQCSAVFERLNSKRKLSHPFYKPISKIIDIHDDDQE